MSPVSTAVRLAPSLVVTVAVAIVQGCHAGTV